MKIKCTTDDPFVGKEVSIIDEEEKGYLTDKCREIFEHCPEVYKITMLLDYPLFIEYERLDEINE